MRVSVATIACILPGCWSLTTDVPDLTSGGARDAAAEDASSTDASANESGTSDGGANDGGPSSDAAFCIRQSPAPTLCDDFDEGALGAKWNHGLVLESGGTGTLDGTDFLSPPRAFSSVTPAGATNDPAARLEHAHLGKPARAEISFDARLDEAAADATFFLCGVPFDLGSGKFYRIDFGRIAGGYRFFESRNDGPSGATLGNGTTPFVGWKHFDVVITFGATARATAKIDGVSALDVAIAPPEPTLNETLLQVGLYTGGPYPSPSRTALRFDNVVVRLTTR